MNLYFQKQTLRPRLECGEHEGAQFGSICVEPRCGIGLTIAIVGLAGSAASTIYSFHKQSNNAKKAANAQAAFNAANRPAPLQVPNAGRASNSISVGGYSTTAVKQDDGTYSTFVSTSGKLLTPDQLLAAKGNSPGLAMFLQKNGYTVASDGTLITGGGALAGADTTTTGNFAGAANSASGGISSVAGDYPATSSTAGNVGAALLVVAVGAGAWMILRKKK